QPRNIRKAGGSSGRQQESCDCGTRHDIRVVDQFQYFFLTRQRGTKNRFQFRVFRVFRGYPESTVNGFHNHETREIHERQCSASSRGVRAESICSCTSTNSTSADIELANRKPLFSCVSCLSSFSTRRSSNLQPRNIRKAGGSSGRQQESCDC